MKDLTKRILWPWALVAVLAWSLYPTAQTTIANNAAEMANKIVMLADGTVGRTVTNLFTFSRSTSAPFAVNSGAAKVTNLNADQVDGYEAITLLDIGNCQGRLSLTSGTPVTTADVTAATSVFFEPYRGYQCAVYDGSATWLGRTFTELSVSIAGFAANSNFDVWLYDSSGTLTLETLVWSSDTARATALTTQNGVLVKSGATTRRYLGTFRTTGTVGQTEDSLAKRFVWNYNNRVTRGLRVMDPTDTWNYTINTWRQADAAVVSTQNQLAFVCGFGECYVKSGIRAYASNATTTQVVNIAVGVDSTTAPTSGNIGLDGRLTASSAITPMSTTYEAYSAVGYHFWAWLEIDTTATGTTTWYGDNSLPTLLQSGIFGSIEG